MNEKTFTPTGALRAEIIRKFVEAAIRSNNPQQMIAAPAHQPKCLSFKRLQNVAIFFSKLGSFIRIVNFALFYKEVRCVLYSKREIAFEINSR